MLGERIGFKNLLGRGAARASLVEDLRLGPNIRAVKAHAYRNVTHQRHAELVEFLAHGPPLRHRHPLDVVEIADETVEAARIGGVQRAVPIASGLGILVLGGPVGKNLVVVIPRSKRAKERVVTEPLTLLHDEFFKLPDARAFRLLKIFESGGEQLLLHRLDLRVLHLPFAEQFDAVLVGDFFEIGFREIGQPAGVCGQRAGLVGNRADEIVGAVVVAGFVDGEDLDQAETFFGGPTREFHE